MLILYIHKFSGCVVDFSNVKPKDKILIGKIIKNPLHNKKVRLNHFAFANRSSLKKYYTKVNPNIFKNLKKIVTNEALKKISQ